MQTSPMHPPLLPMNKSKFDKPRPDKSWTLPFLKIISGVAEVMASALKGLRNQVICLGQEASRNARAARAGLKIFAPKPPKACLQIAIAKIPPASGIHKGTPEERLKAKSRPVRKAEPSLTVIFLRANF